MVMSAFVSANSLEWRSGAKYIIYLGCKVEAVAVALEDPLGGGGDGKVRNIRRRLTAAHDHDGLAHTKLGPRLELRRMDALRDVLDAGNVRNIGRHVETSADGDGVTSPVTLLTRGLHTVRDDMAASLGDRTARDGHHPGGEVDVRPEVKVGAVLIEVFEVARGGEKVRLVITGAEVREAGKLLR